MTSIGLVLDFVGVLLIAASSVGFVGMPDGSQFGGEPKAQRNGGFLLLVVGRPSLCKPEVAGSIPAGSTCVR